MASRAIFIKGRNLTIYQKMARKGKKKGFGRRQVIRKKETPFFLL